MVPFTTTPVDKPRVVSIAGERRESVPATVATHRVEAPQEPDVAPRLLKATVLQNDAQAIAAAHDLAAAAQMSLARALPGPREGSCRCVVVVPDKYLAGGLVGFSARISPRFIIF